MVLEGFAPSCREATVFKTAASAVPPQDQTDPVGIAPTPSGRPSAWARQKSATPSWCGPLTFWGGGCDAQKVLQQGTPAEVKKETAYMIDIFCPGGGFVFTQVHNLQPGTPPENIIAMFEVIAERNDDSTR